jgi:hypothetical protein
MVHQVRRALVHATAHATEAEAPAFATEGHQVALAAMCYMESLEIGVLGLIYLDSNSIPDVVEAAPRITDWATRSSLSMGNWVSRHSIIRDMSHFNSEPPLIHCP